MNGTNKEQYVCKIEEIFFLLDIRGNQQTIQ